MSATAAAMQSLMDIRKFLVAGHAKFTLVSKKTGNRKTFEVLRAPPRPPDQVSNGFFVRLLCGPDNGSDFRYLGFMAEKGVNLYFYPNKRGWGGEAAEAFRWLIATRGDAGAFFAQAEFWHAGFCARCGRELTDPESIARGLGPICAGY